MARPSNIPGLSNAKAAEPAAAAPRSILATQNIYMNNAFSDNHGGGEGNSSVDRTSGEELGDPSSIYAARSRESNGRLQTPFPGDGGRNPAGISSGDNRAPGRANGPKFIGPSPSRNFWPAEIAGEADTQAYSGLGVTDGSAPQAFSNLDRAARYLGSGKSPINDSPDQNGLGNEPTRLFQEYIGLEGYAASPADMGDESDKGAEASRARVVMRSAALGVAQPWHFLSAAYLRDDITQYSSGAVGGSGAAATAKNAYAPGNIANGPYGWEGHSRTDRY